MTKSNMDIISESSEQIGQNLSIYFSNQSSTNELNSISKKSKTQSEKKIFEVFHKKELIYNENNSEKKMINQILNQFHISVFTAKTLLVISIDLKLI